LWIDGKLFGTGGLFLCIWLFFTSSYYMARCWVIYFPYVCESVRLLVSQLLSGDKELSEAIILIQMKNISLAA
jgi:hypothetical protein